VKKTMFFSVVRSGFTSLPSLLIFVEKESIEKREKEKEL